MANYTLTYFDFPGSRGEECRIALHVSGAAFEDERIVRDAWATLKPTSPYGGLPILTVAGKGALAQSNAILSFVGRAHGLLPTDPWEAAHHEAVMCAVEDFRAQLNPSGRIADPELKRIAREEFAAGYLKTWAAAIERQLEASSEAGPFFGGAALSVADIKLFIIMRSIIDGGIDHVSRTAFVEFTGLSRLYEAVRTDARVAAWTNR